MRGCTLPFLVNKRPTHFGPCHHHRSIIVHPAVQGFQWSSSQTDNEGISRPLSPVTGAALLREYIWAIWRKYIVLQVLLELFFVSLDPDLDTSS
jgi:hypothetical protein